MPELPSVLAAGGLVWRDGPAGPQVIVIHRPTHGDWSLPKGKLDPAEHVLAAAVREIEEETGVAVRLGPPLPPRRYRIPDGALKEVRFWLARPVSDHQAPLFEPNREVDEVAWLPPGQARQQLTLPSDVDLLSALDGDLRNSEPLVIVRHANALPRKTWQSDDSLRPLSATGMQQAGLLPALLAAYGVELVVSSDALRCVQTVQPYLDAANLELTAEHGLSEAAESPDAARRLIAAHLDDSISTAVCTHRKVLPFVFDAIGIDGPQLEPGGVVVVHRSGGAVLAIELHSP